MKFKTTQKAIKEGYRNIIKIGYCDLQYLLYHKNPVAYTSGGYGWNADIYDIGGGIAICTGYRPFGDIQPDYELIREYDKRAEAIAHGLSYNPIKAEYEINKLLSEFIEKILGE